MNLLDKCLEKQPHFLNGNKIIFKYAIFDQCL